MIVDIINMLEPVLLVMLIIMGLILLLKVIYQFMRESDLIDTFLKDTKLQLSIHNFHLPKKVYYAPREEYGWTLKYFGYISEALMVNIEVPTNNPKNKKESENIEFAIFILKNYFINAFEMLFSIFSLHKKEVLLLIEMKKDNKEVVKYDKDTLLIENPIISCVTKNFIVYFDNENVFWSFINALFENMRGVASFNTALKSELISDMKFTTLEGMELELEEKSIFDKHKLD